MQQPDERDHADDSLTGFIEEAKDLFVGPEGDRHGMGVVSPYKTLLPGLQNVRRSSNGGSLQSSASLRVSASGESSEDSEARNASISSTTLSSFGDLTKDPSIARAIMEAALEADGLLPPMEEEDEHDLDLESSSRHVTADSLSRNQDGNFDGRSGPYNGSSGHGHYNPAHGTHYGGGWRPVNNNGEAGVAEEKPLTVHGSSSLYAHDPMDDTPSPPKERATAADVLAPRGEAVEHRGPSWALPLGPPQGASSRQDPAAAAAAYQNYGAPEAAAANAAAELPSLGSLLRSPEIAGSRSWDRGIGAPPFDPDGSRGGKSIDGMAIWGSHAGPNVGSWDDIRGGVGVGNASFPGDQPASSQRWAPNTGFPQSADSGGQPLAPMPAGLLPPQRQQRQPPPASPLVPQPQPLAAVQRHGSGMKRLFGRSPSTRKHLSGGGGGASSHSLAGSLPEDVDASAVSAASASGSGSSFLRRLSSGKLFGRSFSKRSSAGSSFSGLSRRSERRASGNLDDGSEVSRTNDSLGRYRAHSASGAPDDDDSGLYVRDGRGGGSTSAPPLHTHAAPAATASWLPMPPPQQLQQQPLGGAEGGSAGYSSYNMTHSASGAGAGTARAAPQMMRRESAPAMTMSALSISGGDYPGDPNLPRQQAGFGNFAQQQQHPGIAGTALGAAMWQHQQRRQPGEPPEPDEVVQLHAQERLRHMDPTAVGYLAGPQLQSQPYGNFAQPLQHLGSAPAAFGSGGGRQHQQPQQGQQSGGGSVCAFGPSFQEAMMAPPPPTLMAQRTAPAALGGQHAASISFLPPAPAEAAAARGSSSRTVGAPDDTQRQEQSKAKRASWPRSSWRMLESLIPIPGRNNSSGGGRGGGGGGGSGADASNASASRRGARSAGGGDGSQRPSLSWLGSGFAMKMKRQKSVEISEKPAKRRQRKGGDEQEDSGEEEFCPRCCDERCTCARAAAGPPAQAAAATVAAGDGGNGGNGGGVERAGFMRSRQEVAAARPRERGRFKKGPSPWVSVTQMKRQQKQGL